MWCFFYVSLGAAYSTGGLDIGILYPVRQLRYQHQTKTMLKYEITQSFILYE